MPLFPEWQELKEYIEDERGGKFDYTRMGGYDILVEREFATFDDPLEFYKHGLSYLYHLTAFGLDQWKHPYFLALREQVKPCDVLDYGCGTGEDGLRLARAGFAPSFADFDSECTKYLKWRLAKRGEDWPVYDIEKDDIPRHSLVVSLDVVEHIPTEEQWDFVLRLAELGQRVAFNVPHGDSRSTLHYRVDVLDLVRRLRETFNLFYHRVFNEFQHFVIFDTSEWYSTTLAMHPGLTDWVTTQSADFEEVEDGSI